MMREAIQNHKMFSESDYNYFVRKGYSDDEILVIWDRDEADGGVPVAHYEIKTEFSNPESEGGEF